VYSVGHQSRKAIGFDRHCTVFPGSVHESGEIIEFDNPDDYDPAQSTWDELKKAGSRIAVATVLFKAWASSPRHELALCATATLARLGWTRAEVSDLIKAVATEAKDEELDYRLMAVDTTFERYKQKKSISGEERLRRASW
jgi:hypothetical protein